MSKSNTGTLRFLGATDTVTGSRYLIDHGGTRVLVDCGLFQGFKRLRERNRRPFPVAPSSIDAVLLTHAHLDHTGYLPLLVRVGFRGPIYCTHGTGQLSKLLLPDSGHLQEEEARHAEHTGSSIHDPVLPLYTALDATRSLQSFRPVDFDRPVAIAKFVEAVFVPAGHILGAAQIHLRAGNRTVHFTGDLGRSDDPFMYPPRDLEPVDVLVTESTYGNRRHPLSDAGQELGDVITRTAKRGGVVLIAAFAVGRAETLLLQLARLRRKGAIPAMPIYLNSPMAIDASYMYQQHPEEHRLKSTEFNDMYQLATLTRSADDSKLLNLRGGPMVIISASGMLTGGRILHHLEAYGGDPKNTLILSGYQAGGTRGAALAGGTRDIRIYGHDVHIRAEVVQLEGYSAHADSEAILRWMRTAPRAPRMTYITHGEPEASDALRLRIKHELGWKARVPEYLETIALDHPD